MCAIFLGCRGPWETGGRMSTANRRAVRRRNGLPNWRIVRYADDFGTTKWYGYTFIDDRAVRSLKAKIRALTRRTSQLDPEYVLTRLNQVMHGWANYFRHAVAKNTFADAGQLRLVASHPRADDTAPLEVERRPPVRRPRGLVRHPGRAEPAVSPRRNGMRDLASLRGAAQAMTRTLRKGRRSGCSGLADPWSAAQGGSWSGREVERVFQTARDWLRTARHQASSVHAFRPIPA